MKWRAFTAVVGAAAVTWPLRAFAERLNLQPYPVCQDWLDRLKEPILEPELPIVDTHHHRMKHVGFLAASIVLSAVVLVSGTENGEWRHYSGDLGATKYSPLAQIDRDNVSRLKIAWRHP